MVKRIDDVSAREAEVTAEVARVRQMYPGAGRYRDQMSALLDVLFFKFGERVGANRLVALLATPGQSPSASTAQDEIDRFWGRVRSKFAARFNRPGLPPVLVEMVAEMAERVWEETLAEAEKTFQQQREVATREVDRARLAAADAQEQLALVAAGAEQTVHKLQVANEAREAVGRELAAESARLSAAEATISALTERLVREEQTRVDETIRTQATLDDLKSALDVGVEEQRRLLAIGDDYKQQAARDRSLRVKGDEAQARLTAEVTKLQQQIAQLSSERGVLEGKAAAQERQISSLLRTMADPGSRTLGPQKKKFRPAIKKRKLS
jgi:hypothetical protein